MNQIFPSPIKPESGDSLSVTRNTSVLREFHTDTVVSGATTPSMYFASFNDPRMFELYQLNQRKHFDIWTIIPILLLYYVTVATRFNLQYGLTVDGPLFSAAFAVMLLTSSVLIPFLSCRAVIRYTSSDKQIFKKCQQVVLLLYFCRFEDFVAILGSCILGLYLIARVFAGQCEDVADIWSTQRCNPFADAKSIPVDQVMIIYLAPLMCQVCLRGVTITGLFVSAVIGLAFVVVASVHIGGYLQIWTLAYCGFFMSVTYVIERLMRVSFLQGLAVVAADRLTIEREVALRGLLNQNEVKTKETEMCQLRSLMGNVAHDLKTPLHSIEADLEVLSVFMASIPERNLHAVRDKYQTKGLGVAFDPQSVFNSLNATCKFMAMAINRSQDFMKASNNIALVPAMETFNLAKALAMSVTCIRHLEVERTITVHPPDEDISSHVISDKHWLSENVLCLLSNALKYSDEGTVDVRLRLVCATKPPVGPISKSDSSKKPECEEKSVGGGKVNPFYDISKSLRSTLDYSEVRKNENACKSKTYGDMGLMLLLTVEDNGIGIAEDARNSLFKMFKQAQRMAGGTGLGLYSLSKRVEALGGECGVTDRTDGNQGSKFWFTFPYRPDESGVPHSPTFSPTEIILGPVDEEQELRQLRILVVDDSLSILKVTSRLLQMNGHIVETASNGSIGLKMLKEAAVTRGYDMVLSDLQMPVMDGFEATKRYRMLEAEIMEHERNDSEVTGRKRLLIVGMSANSDAQSKEIALNAGMDYFVEKPFSYKDLKPILLLNLAERKNSKVQQKNDENSTHEMVGDYVIDYVI